MKHATLKAKLLVTDLVSLKIYDFLFRKWYFLPVDKCTISIILKKTQPREADKNTWTQLGVKGLDQINL